ncbi:uncharacterized protein MONOS_6580 [Monocercomonoides exilis]|uniref:uncharacterized protein n=1 Tax=Monocercomonoides exilis TaxID=2049356 RepID=UPI0035599972|nr:hypothetical protein MONOS_6580 [Monocercomonoides exilis]|eukprot:MONOS_6580.1-p1 / transcript=MONOS_6580.1 / gene=MONOS_6580 / organism=Monocercomonoides_exilis_PA203 / gene_product=unspecified product / transcript_product=unspecified product / location=Mono_scaffold00210:9297-10072(-) / protein_length=195 / sequence_SO=supercontig / SO=protein_coding / is_pseudo=false
MEINDWKEVIQLFKSEFGQYFEDFKIGHALQEMYKSLKLEEEKWTNVLSQLDEATKQVRDLLSYEEKGHLDPTIEEPAFLLTDTKIFSEDKKDSSFESRSYASKEDISDSTTTTTRFNESLMNYSIQNKGKKKEERKSAPPIATRYQELLMKMENDMKSSKQKEKKSLKKKGLTNKRYVPTYIPFDPTMTPTTQ